MFLPSKVGLPVNPVLRSSALTAALLLLAGSAIAADSDGNYSVRGIGTLTCAQVVNAAETNAPELVAVVAWADGVLSASNRYEKGIYEALPYNDPPGLLANLVVNLCTTSPEMLYDTAVRTVITILRPVALTKNAESVVADSGQASVSLRPETIELAQERLIALDLFDGPKSGKFNQPMSDALLNFQKQRGLPENGLPDAATVFSLLLN